MEKTSSDVDGDCGTWRIVVRLETRITISAPQIESPTARLTLSGDPLAFHGLRLEFALPLFLRYRQKHMVDIHCHILPNLDDGAESLEMSLQMAEMAIADGITHVIATPHASDQYKFTPEAVQSRLEELRSRIGERLQFSAGCDFHLSFENLSTLRNDPMRFTLNKSSYLLVEFDDFAIPASIEQTIHDLHLAGLNLIITHPERNALIRTQWERFWGWLRQGCLVQVTAQSLTGGFGRRAQAAAEFLLDANAIHFIASDAHNAATRPLRLKPVFDMLTQEKGEDIARALLTENPRAVWDGKSLPYLPEPRDRKNTRNNSHLEQSKKRFWFF